MLKKTFIKYGDAWVAWANSGLAYVLSVLFTPLGVDLLQVDLLASGASLVWPRSGQARATKSREVFVPRYMKSDEGLF